MHIQAVQSSLFHARPEAEAWRGRGLLRPRPEVPVLQSLPSGSTSKCKLAGKEGDFEQLLTLARFEEAKVRDLRETRRNEGTPPALRNQGSTDQSVCTAGYGDKVHHMG